MSFEVGQEVSIWNGSYFSGIGRIFRIAPKGKFARVGNYRFRTDGNPDKFGARIAVPTDDDRKEARRRLLAYKIKMCDTGAFPLETLEKVASLLGVGAQ